MRERLVLADDLEALTSDAGPGTLRSILIAIAVGAIVLRVVAFRGPARRGSATVATLVLFAILALVPGALCVVDGRAYVAHRLPHD